MVFTDVYEIFFGAFVNYDVNLVSQYIQYFYQETPFITIAGSGLLDDF